ncbi:MAG: alpha-ribazole phosphatase [Opitutales bacterium]|nr:alpha-ribazole phosphatase [Opitutales bacterium]MCH8541503.1 alpha-ribazole phosphatase [Opitutales bacterium]
MELTVVRHTRVAVPKGVCYGRSEVPLASTFAEEAKALRDRLDFPFDGVWCSPSERCQKLAAALEVHRPSLEPALREMDFGSWEGRRWDEIDAETLNAWMTDFVKVAPPGGESLDAFNRRVGTWLESLRPASGQKGLIIAHAGTIRCLWANLLGIPLANLFRLQIGYGEVLKFQLGRDPTGDQILQKE